MAASKIIFRRKLYDRLLEWKQQDNGTTALLVEGARRVGKSTLVEEFAKREYETYIRIDFSVARKEVYSLFEDISDLDFLFIRLKLIYNVQLIDRKSLIIFDEVQKCPLARQAVKHLVADGRYDYIETGSLISIKKNIRDIIIPSEEIKLVLRPLDYEEFLWAIGDDVTFQTLREVFGSRRPMGEVVHRKLMRDLRLYMLVGGMPQAVKEYIEKNDFRAVDSVKRNIIQLYEDDFMKIDSSGRLSSMFDAIPAQLSSNASKYQVSSILGNDIGRISAEEYLSELRQSMCVDICYHVDNTSVGMAMTKNINQYKLFTADTGLFVTLAFKDKDFTDNDIYQRLLNDKLNANLGYVYENIVAQLLRAAGNDLYYHTFPDSNGHNYEVDFIIPKKNKICPIEVKSSGYKRHKSLDLFCSKYSDRIIDQYVIYTKDYMRESQLQYLPAYMTSLI